MPEATPRECVTRQRPPLQRGAPSAQPPERQKELSEALARATSELADARAENQLLREKVDALIRRLFGAKSESLDSAQLLLMLQ